MSNAFNRVRRHFWVEERAKIPKPEGRLRYRHPNRSPLKTLHRLLIFAICWAATIATALCETAPVHPEAPVFPLPATAYADSGIPGIAAKLAHRAATDPFNLLVTAIFLAAIVHTFLTAKFTAIAHRLHHRFKSLEEQRRHDWSTPDQVQTRTQTLTHAQIQEREKECDRLQFRAQMFHFLGEVEAVFGIWLIPLFVALVAFKGWSAMTHYVTATSFAEPIFVVVIMAISASRPVLHLAEVCLRRIASLGGGTPAAWWLSILTIGPVLGSFITEPAAMTICALLLGQRFFSRCPSESLKYATLGLLFVNISVGGTLTHFAAPPVVMVAGKWGWGLSHMITHFGWKACAGIVAANAVYFLKFRGELTRLTAPKEAGKAERRPVPGWITAVHLGFIAWTVATSHYPALVILGFLFFLAFTEATGRNQSQLNIRSPLLVGFFLAALVIHGGGQQWWIAPVLSGLTKWPLMIGATLLTAVNDNAAITYLASLVPGFSETLKHAVVAGAVAGGGLTVIANAPNPAGQSILSKHFADGVSPGRLFLAALVPTLIMIAALMLLP